MSESEEPILRARALRKEYGKEETLIRAVDSVDLDVTAGKRWRSWDRAVVGSRPFFICSEESTVRRRASSR
jgi:hypothetical protein